MLTLDGSYGEGGGQVLRSALTLAAVTGQPLQLVHIRAGRRKPGLQPQHLTAVRAVAKVCNARVDGDRLDSQELAFAPQAAPRAGRYNFDVAQAAHGGSAGAVTLILQAVLLPLALAEGTTELILRGGTHVSWSPPFDYLKRVYLPILERIGIAAKAHLTRWGWYPSGGGEVEARVEGRSAAAAPSIPMLQAPVRGGVEPRRQASAWRSQASSERGEQRPGQVGHSSTPMTLRGLELTERGSLLRVRGLSAASNLPKHIRERQAAAALQALRSQGVDARLDVVDAPSKGQGTVVFLWAEFENVVAGFTSLGERGKPAERVAEEAARDLLDYLHGDAAVDLRLADQLLLPLALASSPSHYTVQRVTQHLLTNAWVVDQFLPGRVRVDGSEGQPGEVWVG